MSGTCNKMLHQELDALLDDAFLEGNSSLIINLLHEAPEDYGYLEIIAQKMKSLNLCLVSLDQNEAIVKNILKILTDVIVILKSNEEQSSVIAECMLRIATEERVHVNILRCVMYFCILNWI
ncbi:hypothetical protein AVEN_119134-1 [Araneus ventricosus]|uniref:Uncharacterized protein n=1 Tax=Araneus ventricosus TaxID=182803 RepID=A0A4Y2BLD1_ARAVE|nr:hypothetical protein AVEN_119134-1 [Araneus ventricosus]